MQQIGKASIFIVTKVNASRWSSINKCNKLKATKMVVEASKHINENGFESWRMKKRRSLVLT